MKPCPFCGAEEKMLKILDELRGGYEDYRDDPDACAYFVFCGCCAAQGGWAKSATGAVRNWDMRVEDG